MFDVLLQSQASELKPRRQDVPEERLYALLVNLPPYKVDVVDDGVVQDENGGCRDDNGEVEGVGGTAGASRRPAAT